MNQHPSERAETRNLSSSGTHRAYRRPRAAARHQVEEEEYLDVQALKSGDELVWEQAFRLLWPSVYRAARHPKANLTQDEAEDAASQAMAQLPGRISEVKNLRELRALAVTISYCRAISLARHEHASKRDKSAAFSIEERQEQTEGHFELAAKTEEAGREMEGAELLAMLQEGMEVLDEITRSIMMECYLDQASYKDLGLKYNLTENAVGMKLHWGKKRVREFFKKRKPHLLKELQHYLR